MTHTGFVILAYVVSLAALWGYAVRIWLAGRKLDRMDSKARREL